MQPDTGSGKDSVVFDRTSTARASGPRAEEHDVPDEVFEHLPHGIAVTDRVGALLAWNRALEEILGLDDDALGKTCCELFGCGTP